MLKNNLLSDHQSVFHSNYSTQYVLLHVTDSWQRAIDESKFTAVAFLDISKVFDGLNHNILLSKLACCGVLDTLLLGLRVTYHVINKKLACMDHHLSGVKHMLVCLRRPIIVQHLHE